ncbi:hypothetical protein [Natrinema versiforme]|uniref:Uncharacterized protein n=1 Tax=Natrinema versiforme JCM 10478 TaxID=1227496 RepID=L9Y534_9EURY|nr:hypothetical protein [Natrinema versiforme]ELY68781.1 hypothetical protein C489_06758 [Natrinema versiforme JCM 10478]
MSVVFAILLVVSLVIPLVLWLAINQETSNPTVVDREEAERIAKAQGGRDPSRSATDSPSRGTDDDRTDTNLDDNGRSDEGDDRTAGFDWDERDEWGSRRS